MTKKQESSTRLKHTKRCLKIIPCCYISLVYYNHPVANAFSPGGGGDSLLNKNKKCRGVASCHRSSSLSNASSAASTTYSKQVKVRGGTFCCGNGQGPNGGQSSRNDSFQMMMAKFNYEQREKQFEAYDIEEDHNNDSSKQNTELKTDFDNESNVQQRRMFIATLFATSSSAIITTTSNPEPAIAFEKSYPVNLDFDNDDSSINLQSIRQERIAVQKSQAKQVKSDLLTQPFMFKTKEDIISSVVWGGALWLLTGSRSNPLVRPLANILYDENTEEGAWVKDRNDGLFAPLPAGFMAIMGILFLILGFVTDRGLLLLADGNSNSVLQMAGVSLIGGASLELGRIASGEKMITREDLNRKTMLADEFSEFASNRLIVGEGGAVHRSEIIKAFRRYFAKYRVENDQYPLTDLEIERLIRTWNRMEGNEEGISSAGFLKGVKINDQAVLR